ncbi:MAG: DnaD domain protein [Ruminococcus sp.]|nr:DnaD domain protein [Ruminococcus sp.]
MIYRLGIMPFGRVFTVPCAAVEYLKLADAGYCKALMAMLCTDVPVVDTEELAKSCDISVADAEDAVMFWADRGVITIVADGAENSAPVTEQHAVQIEKSDALRSEQTAQQPERVCLTDAIDPMKKTAAAKSTIRYTPKDIAKKIEEDKELKSLFNEVQKIFGRPINGTEATGFVNLYEYYGYSAPSLLMIAQFAHDLGKDKMAYIESVARDWYNRGITDYTRIEEEIIRQTALNTIHGKIKRVLGIDCELTKRQKEYFDSWIEWGFKPDVIELAGERCRENRNKVDIKYINGILNSWHNDGLMSTESVYASEQAYADKKQNEAASAGSFDAESWEDMVMNFDPSVLSSEEGQ